MYIHFQDNIYADSYVDRRISMVFWGMDLLERIIKFLQIPPSGCSRSSQSSDLLTLLTRRRVRSLLGDEMGREESLAVDDPVRRRVRRRGGDRADRATSLLATKEFVRSRGGDTWWWKRYLDGWKIQ